MAHQIVLPIIFLTSNYMTLDFYITPLNSFYSLILECNWLVQHNPLIDWANILIKFYSSLQKNLVLSYITANIPLVSLLFSDISLQLLNPIVSISVFRPPYLL